MPCRYFCPDGPVYNSAKKFVVDDWLGTKYLSNRYLNVGIDPNNTEFTSIGAIFSKIIDIVFFVGLALALIFIIICGIRYVVSGGDQSKSDEARACIINAIIGAVIIIAFRVILAVIFSALDINLSDQINRAGGI